MVLFDGYCHLCNTTENFIIKHDINNLYTLISLQSEEGQLYLEKYSLPLDDFDTVILIENNKVYTASTAALMILKNLSGGVKYLYWFIVIPQVIRDFIYKLISKNRYTLFGKKRI
ncbi:thiol-disulfide oxidoreductase DCC family protein [Sulfurimonas sp.]|uniref:thiol-disulfide oxidoreductase DCC family protein n=1 Tax=Sulfurimonas sp. TaxID=2022749 RepID=UPI0039E29FF5